MMRIVGVTALSLLFGTPARALDEGSDLAKSMVAVMKLQQDLHAIDAQIEQCDGFLSQMGLTKGERTGWQAKKDKLMDTRGGIAKELSGAQQTYKGKLAAYNAVVQPIQRLQERADTVYDLIQKTAKCPGNRVRFLRAIDRDKTKLHRAIPSVARTVVQKSAKAVDTLRPLERIDEYLADDVKENPFLESIVKSLADLVKGTAEGSLETIDWPYIKKWKNLDRRLAMAKSALELADTILDALGEKDPLETPAFKALMVFWKGATKVLGYSLPGAVVKPYLELIGSCLKAIDPLLRSIKVELSEKNLESLLIASSSDLEGQNPAPLYLGGLFGKVDAVAIDLSGRWKATGYNETETATIRIEQQGDLVRAIKETGNKFIPAGEVTFEFRFPVGLENLYQQFTGRARIADIEGEQSKTSWVEANIALANANADELLVWWEGFTVPVRFHRIPK